MSNKRNNSFVIRAVTAVHYCQRYVLAIVV